MMRNFVKGLTVCSCLAFALFNGDCWGMETLEWTESDQDSSKSILDASASIKLASLPIITREIEQAINKWSHLVPKGEVKAEIDNLVPQVLGNREKMEQLVTLICSPSNSSKFANYAHMVFVAVFSDCSDEERNKLERMLDVIADHRGGGGGLDFATYLMYYDSGRYDDYLPEGDDDFESSKW